MPSISSHSTACRLPYSRHFHPCCGSPPSFVASRFIMRVGAKYREALRDGRKVFVMGEGRIDDVTTHPATSAMVEQYVAWYDRHFDPAWADTLLTRSGVPWSFVLPKTSTEAVAIGRCIQETILLSAGNITHTPLYGHLIALYVLTAAETRNAGPQHAANAMAYR